MLIRSRTLERIKRGEVTLAFRRWRRPTVKTGGTLQTAIGVLNIENVQKTSLRAVSDDDAIQAGYAARDALVKELGKRDGDLYKITLAFAGDDPRIKLRADKKLSEEEFTEVCLRLKRFDAASRQGAWTHRVLTVIRDHPKRPAAELANQTGDDKAWLKTNVRKLKNMGLTISHQVGYTLSPRGIAVLKRLEKDG